MSTFSKTKIVSSSDFSFLADLDDEPENLIPHPQDPIRDIIRNYWKLTDSGTIEKEVYAQDTADNKIYLDEERNFYTTQQSSQDEYVKIYEYSVLNGTSEIITLMQPGLD